MKVINFDISKCTGCRICELICSFNKEKEIKPQLSRVSVISNHSLGLTYVITCNNCSDAPCIKVCPTNSLRKNPEGYTVYDKITCIGCRTCVNTCPFGALSYSTEKKEILKCDLCNGEVLCCQFCPTGALTFQEPINFSHSKIYSIALKNLKIHL